MLAGNSLGGLVAANLTAKRPELVEALVFLNATPFWGFNKPWLPVWKGQLPVPKVRTRVCQGSPKASCRRRPS